MSERAKKNIGQDLVGAAFCLLGGFFAVSMLLRALGREPVVPLATTPVIELVGLLGTGAGFVLSLGVALVGAWIFLASQAPTVGRPLAAIALGSLGLSLILGAFAWGGTLGDVFPSLVSGTPGRLIGAVLGALAVLATPMLLPTRRSSTTPADMMRAGIGSRAELAGGVSAAESALLVADARPTPRVAPRVEETREIPRPKAAPARPAAPLAQAVATPVRTPASAPAPAELPTPAAPSWEDEEARDEEAEEPELAATPTPDEEDEAELAAQLADALTSADEADEEEEPEADEPEPAAVAPSAPPTASWEQVNLFDEPEEEADKIEEATPAQAAATSGTLDFGEARPAHEPERGTADDPFAAEPVTPPVRAAAAEELLEDESEQDSAEREEAESDAADADEAEQEPAHELTNEADEDDADETEDDAQEPEELAAPLAASAPVTLEAAPTVSAPAPAPSAPAPRAAPAAPEFVLQPKPAAPRPEPVVARDSESEKWQKLIFDSGLLILEQKRVAVSMLERRFGIDFDTACKVLDELQQAGLIGPYIGGRTRDILLSREQWQAQAHEPA